MPESRQNNVSLHVRDAGTRRELTGLEMARSSWRFGCEHPGPVAARQLLHVDMSSPFETAELHDEQSIDRDKLSLFVRATGCAWNSIELAPGSGDRELLLYPGGDLCVRLEGVVADSRIRVHVRRKGHGGDIAWADCDTDSVAFDSLQAGTVDVVACTGDVWRGGVVLGSSQANIVPGLGVTATIRIDWPRREFTARLVGQVVVPRSWTEHAQRVGVQLLSNAGDDRSTRRESPLLTRKELPDRMLYDWSFDDLQPGRYKVEVDYPPCCTVVDLPPEGRDDIVINVGAPSSLVLSVVDELTGQLVEPERILWHPDCGEPLEHRLQIVDHVPTSGPYNIRCAAGMVRVRVIDRRFRVAGAAISVHSPITEYALSVSSAASFRLKLLDGDTAVPFPQHWNLEIESPGGSVVEYGMIVDADSWVYRVDRSGPLVLKFGDIPGFQRVPDQALVLDAGGIVDVSLRLVRE